MRSMTGFGRGAAESAGVSVRVAVQGGNHRHADLVFRLPEELRPFEAGLRERVARVVARGRCEVSVRLDAAAAGTGRQLDREAIARFVADAEEWVRAGTIDRRWTLGELARAPFWIAAPADGELAAPAREAVESALDAALAQFDEARRAEGARLAAVLGEAIDELERWVAVIGSRRRGIVEIVERGLRERLDEMLPGGAAGLPPERLAQEIVLLADRSDVGEELDRLAGHLVGLRDNLAAPGPHGRRLDFVIQEVLRELNTLGAKSRDLEITRAVVEAKVVNERLREQIQNVE